jgi:hypothetical protein
MEERRESWGSDGRSPSFTLKTLGRVENVSEEAESMAKEIRQELGEAGTWTRVKTPVRGIFIVKMPEKFRFRVSLMFNPPDEFGDPIKQKGLYFDNSEVADAAKRAFSDPMMPLLLEAIRNANNNNVASRTIGAGLGKSQSASATE